MTLADEDTIMEFEVGAIMIIWMMILVVGAFRIKTVKMRRTK